MPVINDSSYEERVLYLVTEVLLLNGETSDPTDYSITAVEPNLDQQHPFNSILRLAPINVNLQLPNLELFFDRLDINEVLAPLEPKIFISNNDQKVSDVISEIQASINDQVILDIDNFYDTYVAEQPDEAFIQLHALPESFFYIGQTRVPVQFVPRDIVVSFDITIENIPVELTQ